ncbi:hypothetical protein LXA43DRAFT_1179533 [Ganoderma leucocontextum]|nr:hypothetical protein LXA43DRAFT_1179533 [Ganoderma leucocontextum]
MDSDTIITLQYFVTGIYDLLTDIVLSAFLFGVLTVLSIVSIAHLIRRGIKQPSTAFMLGSVLVLYVSTTTHFSVLIAYSVRCVRLVNGTVASLSSTSSFNAALVDFRQDAKTKSYIISAALAINVAIGDAIVWWRAFALWRTRSVIALGSVLLIVTPALGIVSMIHGGSGQIYIYIPLPPQIVVHNSDVYGAISGIVSLLTNMTATLLIGRKAWQHKKILSQGLGASKGRWMTPTMKVLLLLVESGTVYSIILAVAVAYNLVSSSPSGLGSSPKFVSVIKVFLGGCFVQILAIYPTVIIFIVAINQSILEGSLVNASPSSAIPTRILPGTVVVSSSSTTHMPLSTSSLCSSHLLSASESPENVSTDDAQRELELVANFAGGKVDNLG